MKINSITVGGFKNLNTTKLELGNICAIISPNNYGKSNLLEAIDFGFDFIHESRKGRKNMMGWVKGIPLCFALDNSEFQFEFEFEDDELGEYKYVRYGYSFKWYRDDEKGACITDEWLETRENTSVRYTSYLKRNEKKYRKGKSTTAYRKIDLDEYQLAIDVLNLVEEIEITNVINSIQKIVFRVCSSLDLGDRYVPAPFEFADEENIVRFDDADVPRALVLLKSKAPELYNLFEESLSVLFPEFTSISLNEFVLTDQNIEKQMVMKIENNKLIEDEDVQEIPFRLREHIYRLFVKCDYMNQPLSMVNMSAGTKRVIWLLTNAYIANCIGTGIVGIEEIETSIHPKMIKQLLEILTEALGGAPLIISSHSPYLVQYLKPDKIYVGVPNSQGVAEFRRIQKSKIKTVKSNARDMELSVGEYLFELLSGDSDSYETLDSFLEVHDN